MFQVKCFSKCWELALRNRDGLVGEGVTGGRKAGCFTRISLDP